MSKLYKKLTDYLNENTEDNSYMKYDILDYLKKN